MLDILEKLSNLRGVSGYEDAVKELMKRELRKSCDEVNEDRFGNVIGKKGHGKPVVMLAAHMDEVGFMVKHIDDNGYVKFISIGGIDDRILPGQKVRILAEKKEISGVIGFKPPHLMKKDEKKNPVEADELFIDTGLSKDEAKELIEVGSPIIFDSTFEDLKNGKVLGRAFDNRIGCLVMLEAMKRLNKTKCTIYAVGTCQEELGLKGARTAAYSIKPDYALALDTTISGDTPDIKSMEANIKLGKGPCITVIEAAGRGMVPSPKVKRHLINCAKEKEIPYQLDVWKQGMTDAAIIYISNEGIPTGGICIPTRYIHAPYSIADVKDIKDSIDLTVSFIESIGEI